MVNQYGRCINFAAGPSALPEEVSNCEEEAKMQWPVVCELSFSFFRTFFIFFVIGFSTLCVSYISLDFIFLL